MKKGQRGVMAGPGLVPRTASMSHMFPQPSLNGLLKELRGTQS